jgi:hypothetical protein
MKYEIQYNSIQFKLISYFLINKLKNYYTKKEKNIETKFMTNLILEIFLIAIMFMILIQTIVK